MPKHSLPLQLNQKQITNYHAQTFRKHFDYISIRYIFLKIYICILKLKHAYRHLSRSRHLSRLFHVTPRMHLLIESSGLLLADQLEWIACLRHLVAPRRSGADCFFTTQCHCVKVSATLIIHLLCGKLVLSWHLLHTILLFISIIYHMHAGAVFTLPISFGSISFMDLFFLIMHFWSQ